MNQIISRSLVGCALLLFGFSPAVNSPALAAESAPEKPVSEKPAWQWEKTPVPLVFEIDGIWYEWFRLDSARDRAGMRKSQDFKNLSKGTVIVLANAATNRIPKEMQAQLREFVQEGGGLVVLGGYGAYGNGGYTGSPIEEILPVLITESRTGLFPDSEKGARLAPAEKADWPMSFDFTANPTAYYFQKLIPKPGAKVQVWIGNQPAFVSGTFGKGRVVACSLMTNGNPPAGVVPFWDWKDWPALLGQALEWAGGARPAGMTMVRSAETGSLKPLSENELNSGGLSMESLPKDFVKRALLRPDEKTALALLDLAAPTGGDEARCGLDTVLTALLPYAKPAWAARLGTLAEDMNPNLKTRQAALTLMGACSEPSVYPTLMKALKDKAVQLAAMDGLSYLGKVEAIPELKAQFEAALKPARLPEGGDRWKAAPFAEASLPAVHAAIALYRLGDPEAVERLGTLASSLELYVRIFWNASNRWPKDPQGQAILKEIKEQRDLLDAAWATLQSGLVPIPESQASAFIKYAARVEHPVIVELIAQTMERSADRLPKADWTALAKAKSGIITKMSK